MKKIVLISLSLIATFALAQEAEKMVDAPKNTVEQDIKTITESRTADAKQTLNDKAPKAEELSITKLIGAILDLK